MIYETAYNKAIELLNRDIGFLFQRLNFFLIVTGIFFAGFGTSMAIGEDPIPIKPIAYLLCVTGLFFSFLFACINYINTRIIFQIRQYIVELEGHEPLETVEASDQPYSKVNSILEQAMDMKSILCVIPHMFNQIISLSRNPKNAATQTVVDHTYIVPLFFAGIWFVLIFVILWAI